MDKAYSLFNRHFRTRVFLRVGFIGIVQVAATVAYIRTEEYVWLVVGGIIILWQCARLVSSMERMTKDLNSFLESIQYSDFTQTYRSPFSDRIFSSLYEAFNNVLQSFRDIRAEGEAQRRYFEKVVHHVGIGLLCYHPTGKVVLINRAAKRLLSKSTLLDVHDLESLSVNLKESLLTMKAGEHRLIHFNTDHEQLQLSLHAAHFLLQNEKYILVSFQNISSQLEASEMEAMQHMSRVLAHEIMNSITPIVSLAALAREAVEEQMPVMEETQTEESVEDLVQALDTIENRSKGLLRFVSAYRSITRIPEPDAKMMSVHDILSRAVSLFEAQLHREAITVHVHTNPNELSVLADPDLIEQVLINLIKNAVEALNDQPDKKIELEGLLDRKGRVLIKVTDNGSGVPKEIADNIFVPFFSTKTEGSGIGLSFSRYVMQRHNGALLLQSETGTGTTLTLRF